MRWLACFVLLTGCLRARATVVHPTELERTKNVGPSTTIARVAPHAGEVAQPEEEASKSLFSVELGVPLRLDALDGASRIHIAPGARIFSSQVSTVLWGVAVGVDYVGNRRTGFALEGSVHICDGGTDSRTINQALDLFAGVTVHSPRTKTSIAVGPSVGILAMPGHHSVVMVGLGVRLGSGRTY